MNAKPAISVIIRTKNQERCIGKTLKAIFEQKIDMPFEVIAIDSGSSDRTIDIVRQFNVKIYNIKPDEFTYGRALNYGMELSQGEYLINISDHCVPVRTSWMADLINPLLSDSSIAATFGKQEPFKGINPFEEKMLATHFDVAENGKPRQVFSNANCAIKKQILRKYPFDEKASFGEDFIWAQTLPLEHNVIYVKSASVYHSHPLSFKYWSKRNYNHGLFLKYIEIVYRLNYQVGYFDFTKTGLGETLFRLGASYIYENLYFGTYLIKKKYFKFIPIMPIFLFLKSYHFNKGIKDGTKLYGVQTLQKLKGRL